MSDVCRRCGACCLLGGIRLQPEDGARIPTHLTEPDPNHGCVRLRTCGDRCVALDGTPGVWCGCSLWAPFAADRRPLVCRVFPRGGLDCDAARQRLGLHPLPDAEREGFDSFMRGAERALHGLRGTNDPQLRAALRRRVFGDRP